MLGRSLASARWASLGAAARPKIRGALPKRRGKMPRESGFFFFSSCVQVGGSWEFLTLIGKKSIFQTKWHSVFGTRFGLFQGCGTRKYPPDSVSECAEKVMNHFYKQLKNIVFLFRDFFYIFQTISRLKVSCHFFANIRVKNLHSCQNRVSFEFR